MEKEKGKGEKVRDSWLKKRINLLIL